MIKKRGLLVLLLLMVIVLSGCTGVSEEITEGVEKTTGGVIICSVDYPCGNADNICPQDYGADCKVQDPDCGE